MAIDAILGAIDILLNRQNAAMLEVQRSDSCRRNTWDEIEVQKQAKIRHDFFVKNLDRRVVLDPMFDGQGKRPCNEGTRTVDLAIIKEWLHATSPGSQIFF